MRITVLTVSPPAVRWLPLAAAKINARVPGAVELRLYYVAGTGASSRLSQMQSDMAAADALFLDLMGASPDVCAAVSGGCAACHGNILPYGASSREYLRLGAFRADSMQGSSSHAPSMDAMKKMQGMAETVGKILPGKIRDMRNYSLLMKYFQNTSEENILGMLLLLCREYGGISGLPAPAPPKVNAPIALYDTSSMTALPSLSSLEAAMPPERQNVALLFSAYAYPTDTDACVAAIVQKLSPFCNVYPIGITGHFSEVAAELRKLLTQARGGIDLILDCIPF